MLSNIFIDDQLSDMVPNDDAHLVLTFHGMRARVDGTFR